MNALIAGLRNNKDDAVAEFEELSNKDPERAIQIIDHFISNVDTIMHCTIVPFLLDKLCFILGKEKCYEWILVKWSKSSEMLRNELGYRLGNPEYYDNAFILELFFNQYTTIKNKRCLFCLLLANINNRKCKETLLVLIIYIKSLDVNQGNEDLDKFLDYIDEVVVPYLKDFQEN